MPAPAEAYGAGEHDRLQRKIFAVACEDIAWVQFQVDRDVCGALMQDTTSHADVRAPILGADSS